MVVVWIVQCRCGEKCGRVGRRVEGDRGGGGEVGGWGVGGRVGRWEEVEVGELVEPSKKKK